MRKMTERGAVLLLSLALLGSACVLPAAAEKADEPDAVVQNESATHTITFTMNGKVVGTAEYTDGDTKDDITYPVYDAGKVFQTYGVPFYRYAWEDFELNGQDITVKGRFTVVHYTVNFVDEKGAAITTRVYNIEEKDYDVPEVPVRDGFVGTWQVRSVDTNTDTVTVAAKYAPLTTEPVHALGHYLAIFEGHSICRTVDTSDVVVENGVISLVGEDGCMELLSGIVQVGSDFFYYENGLPAYKGVVEIEGSFYFFRSNGKMVRGMSYELGRLDQTHGLVPFGTYVFDENGVMQNVEMKEGVIRDEDGELRYYENNLAVYKGVIEYDGDYYYINSTLKAVRNSDGYFIWPVTTNGLISAGMYKMDETGKMDMEDFIPLRVDAVTEGTKGVLFDGDNGSYYFVDADDNMVTNCFYVIYEETTNGLIQPGVYMINGAGVICEKMSDVPPAEKLGLEEIEGSITSIRARAMLFSVSVVGVVTDGNGNYFFINGMKRLAKNGTFRVLEANTNGLIAAGLYDIDEDGLIDLDSHQKDDWSEKWKGNK